MRELIDQEIDAVSGGEIKEVGTCRWASAEDIIKGAVSAWVGGVLRVFGVTPVDDPWD